MRAKTTQNAKCINNKYKKEHTLDSVLGNLREMYLIAGSNCLSLRKDGLESDEHCYMRKNSHSHLTIHIRR